MKSLLVALFICFFHYLHSQNLSGHWVGQLYQNGVGWYDFELLLTPDGHNSYAGTSYISCQRGSGTIALHATMDSKGVHFQESRIQDEHWTTIGWYWCLKSGDLELDVRADSLVLDGSWEAAGTCKPGNLRVAKAYKVQEKISTKPEPPARPVETKDGLQVTEDEVLVEIWDNENEDGDIASISLNGEVILKDHLVTKQKYPFRIALQPGKNTLVLFAENLGTRPPNTAAITIHYDGQTKTVVLNSNLTKSEAIEIIH